MANKSNLRKNMVEELMKEVQGPRYGVNEVIAFDPWNEYISGIVIPQSWQNNTKSSAASPDVENIVDIEDGLGEDNNGDSDINSSFTSSALDPRSMIKSFGVSFSMDKPNPKFSICATWGRYFPDEESETAFRIDGKEVKTDSKETNGEDIWKRYSFGEIFEIEINEDEVEDSTIRKNHAKKNELIIEKILKDVESEKEIEDPEKDGFVKIYIKRLKMSDNLYTFSIYMINELNYTQKENDFHADVDKCLFQPSIRLISSEKIKTQDRDILNESEKELDFLYRFKPTISTGHMCSSIWKDIDYSDKIDLEQLWPDYSIRLEKNPEYEKFKTPDLRTEFIPLYPVTLPNFENDQINVDDFKAEELANKSPEEIYDTLIQLPKIYEEWINKNIEEKKNIEDKYEDTANKLIEDEKQALLRMKKGIKLIRDEDLVYTSFCFANKTIALQNNWGNDSKREFKWRPFQIAFFLMNLEDIFYEDAKNKETMDLLWIPTGGGKTEAYLGIMAFTIALRRLKAYFNEETGAGTSIISRYTLRLLTVQQFRRTLKMITAAEYLRIDQSNKEIGWRPKYSKIKGNWIYGSTRFSTGLWVGGGVSPLHLLKKGGAMDLLKGKDVKSAYSPGEPAQILKCPVCGSWLSVPKTGLSDKINKLHIVLEAGNLSEFDIEKILNELFEENEKINFKSINSDNHKKSFFTASFEIIDKFSRKQYEEELIEPILEYGIEVASLSSYNIGYFTSLNKISRKVRDAEGDFDFEIWCTNPECDLNNVHWEEGDPYPSSEEADFPDGNYKRDIESPFEDSTRMPIPAYIIDDQIYNRCPTVIISTADKIARLAFEPKASAIFGNVNAYNKYYGYNRNGDFPKGSVNVLAYNKQIKPLKAPDLVIQDELHLIEGPLGSLFGLYESMVSAIIEKQGGNPKYIASTATISNAQKQVDLLFSKKLYQFPPHGLDITDNFFVKDYDNEEAWNEEKPGRLYLGVYAPGKGPMTPQVRLWGRMLKTSEDNLDDPLLKNFWTVVGYYNSIKELGGALAMYRDDIKNRMRNIIDLDYSKKVDEVPLLLNREEIADYYGNLESSIEEDTFSITDMNSIKEEISLENDKLKKDVEKHRQLNEDDKEELSSRIDSTELPIILDNLERDGLNDIPKFDAIFTTSMFGTGVDISHLSLMIMTSQPKTTGSYIQATGRIGRKNGGLIVDFLKSGRPRDLNHYEMFPSYHSRIYLDVEPVSVSPFSRGCLARGLGPSVVAFLRNAFDLKVKWQENDGKIIIRNENSKEDINYVYNFLKDRLSNMETVEIDSISPILKYLERCIKDWENIAKSIENDKRLQMYEYYALKPRQNVVLGDSGHENNDNLKVVYSNAPQSLRDVEETITFWV